MHAFERFAGIVIDASTPATKATWGRLKALYR